MSRGSEVVIPTRAGRDIDSADGKLDGHIRIETYEGETQIYLYLFDSSVRDPNQAHLQSKAFSWTDEGADETTKFLQGKGFRVAVVLK